MFLPRRSGAGPPGPLLGWRIASLAAGATLALLGLLLDLDWMIPAAIGILLMGMVLGAFERRG